MGSTMSSEPSSTILTGITKLKPQKILQRILSQMTYEEPSAWRTLSYQCYSLLNFKAHIDLSYTLLARLRSRSDGSSRDYGSLG